MTDPALCDPVMILNGGTCGGYGLCSGSECLGSSLFTDH
jgi:hypothetical protein